MFFYLSKILWFFLQPSSFIILLFALGAYLYKRGHKRPAIRTLFAAAFIYAAGGLLPFGNLLLVPLEQSYAGDSKTLTQPPHGLIVLGGSVDTVVSSTRGETALNEAAERLTEAVALARRFPEAKIVFSGGDASLSHQGMPEASVAARFFTDMGLDPSRVTFEDRSRTTYENAKFTKTLLDPRPGERWLLVTSAFHMLRAAGAFRAAGFNVSPWPVDFRTRGYQDLMRFPGSPSEGWHRIDLAAKEWIGLIAYRVTGRWAG